VSVISSPTLLQSDMQDGNFGLDEEKLGQGLDELLFCEHIESPQLAPPLELVIGSGTDPDGVPSPPLSPADSAASHRESRPHTSHGSAAHPSTSGTGGQACSRRRNISSRSCQQEQVRFVD
jgi:hypothetical protein